MNIDRVQPTPSVALADAARSLKAAGVAVVELQTGDPDFATHPAIIEAAHKAMCDGMTHYSFSAGLPRLRAAIAASLTEEYAVRIEADHVLVTHGAAQGMSSVFSGLVELGDEVIVLEPNWTTVDSMVALAGGVTVKVSHLLDDAALFMALDKACSPRTRMLCFNSPNNPTGTVFSSARVLRLVEWATARGVIVVSDEVYRSLTYHGKAASVLEHFSGRDNLVFVDSFSKTYAMTGWRCGYLVAPSKLFSRIAKASQIAITHVAPFVQAAALEALTNAKVAQAVKDMAKDYSVRRAYLLDCCRKLQLDLVEPDGAFYLFIRLGTDDVEFAKRLLDFRRVCAVPGSAYGATGRGWLRVTYAAPTEHVEEGLRAIASLRDG
jgi:aspartate aminotransferase